MKKYKLILQKTEFYEVEVEAKDMDEARELGKLQAWDEVNWNKPESYEYRVYDIIEK